MGFKRGIKKSIERQGNSKRLVKSTKQITFTVWSWPLLSLLLNCLQLSSATRVNCLPRSSENKVNHQLLNVGLFRLICDFWK